MKKLIITTAIILGIATTTIADPTERGGLFQRGNVAERSMMRDGTDMPMLPNQHGLGGNQNADAPLGTGIAVLLGLGAAYLVGKKRREE